jgi:hypothetical protein
MNGFHERERRLRVLPRIVPGEDAWAYYREGFIDELI